MTDLLKPEDLTIGDVLLCCGEGKIARVITAATGSKYTHAAIYLGNGYCLEAVQGGVQRTATAGLVGRYDRIAAFRQPDAWDVDSQDTLGYFAEKIVATKARYNFAGVVNFEKTKKEYQGSMRERLEAYFSGPTPPIKAGKSAYFCSELVVDCYVATGFILPSAEVVLKAETFTPQRCLGLHTLTL